MLSEIVVTGYQTLSKERTAGAFAKVTGADLQDKRFSSLSSLLEGEVAGYNTQSNLVRGITTMNGVAAPLYVVDGFPVENTNYTNTGSLEENVPNLNIDDIESVTVLKDARPPVSMGHAPPTASSSSPPRRHAKKRRRTSLSLQTLPGILTITTTSD